MTYGIEFKLMELPSPLTSLTKEPITKWARERKQSKAERHEHSSVVEDIWRTAFWGRKRNINEMKIIKKIKLKLKISKKLNNYI